MHHQELYKRIRWQCRRGMLELDLILENFAEHHLPTLLPPQQQAFIELLRCHDNDLYVWLVLKQSPENLPEHLIAICEIIRTSTAL